MVEHEGFDPLKVTERSLTGCIRCRDNQMNLSNLHTVFALIFDLRVSSYLWRVGERKLGDYQMV